MGSGSQYNKFLADQSPAASATNFKKPAQDFLHRFKRPTEIESDTNSKKERNKRTYAMVNGTEESRHLLY